MDGQLRHPLAVLCKSAESEDDMNLWNGTKTFVLLAALTGLVVFIGAALAGSTGLVIGLVVAGVMSFVSYWFSDRILLRMNGAREVGPHEAPELHTIVQRLAARAGIPVPRIYMLAEATPNAFATGRNPANAAVAVTDGLVRMLTREELEGVIAHELAHIRNRDTLVMTVAASIGGALSMIANMAAWGAMFGHSRDSEEGGSGSNVFALLFGILIAPIAASLIQMAISRNREYMADARGAELTGNPIPLARALQKLDSWSQKRPLAVQPATAHLFIVNPLTGGGVTRLFSTHPSTADRVRRLEQMAGR
jgi:heat shock protein HtpX